MPSGRGSKDAEHLNGTTVELLGSPLPSSGAVRFPGGGVNGPWSAGAHGDAIETVGLEAVPRCLEAATTPGLGAAATAASSSAVMVYGVLLSEHELDPLLFSYYKLLLEMNRKQLLENLEDRVEESQHFGAHSTRAVLVLFRELHPCHT